MCSSDLQDTTLILNNTFNYQNYSLTIPFAVDTIIINPNADIITSNSVALSQKQDNIAHLYFSIIPNPSNESINIHFNQLQHHFTLQLFDMLGKIVFENDYSEANTLAIPSNLYSNGVYFIKITGNDFTTGQFVVVNHASEIGRAHV